MISMLHSCDAGEYSVLTGYCPPYMSEDAYDAHSETYFMDGPPIVNNQNRFNKDGMPAWEGRNLEKHEDKLIRPYETMLASGHFAFSHGHLLKVAGHDGSFENLFAWEELWMAYMYWKKGYTLYSPHQTVIWHTYERDYRPVQYTDAQTEFGDEEAEKWVNDYFRDARRMREKIFGDAEFRHYMYFRWGVDLLGR